MKKDIPNKYVFGYFRGDCCGERANFVSVYIAKSDQSTQPIDKVQTHYKQTLYIVEDFLYKHILVYLQVHTCIFTSKVIFYYSVELSIFLFSEIGFEF